MEDDVKDSCPGMVTTSMAGQCRINSMPECRVGLTQLFNGKNADASLAIFTDKPIFGQSGIQYNEKSLYRKQSDLLE